MSIRQEQNEAVKQIDIFLLRCEKIQPKFQSGTAQHTLLVNRIKALQIAKSLILKQQTDIWSTIELEQALPPIKSIISKCAKAQRKYEKGTSFYKRFEPILQAMKIAQSYIEEELANRRR